MKKNKGQFQKGNINWNAGKHLPLSVRQKISIARKGIPNPSRGKKRPSVQGSNHWNWKGGVNPINNSLRKSLEAKLWRKAVFERDGYACVAGGAKHGNKLHADHIKPWAIYPELRFAIDNGRTLCEDCHRKTDTYAGRTQGLKSPLQIVV